MDFLSRYDRMCDRAAAQVMLDYSTSFSLATRFLEPRARADIRNLYAVVRIADEIVDGTAEQAGCAGLTSLLDTYEASALGALGALGASTSRFHTDPILHAWANTARRCQFDPDHVRAFFASMRRDLRQDSYAGDTAGFDDYVYGSAEVIGLLCLSVFLADHSVDDKQRQELERGAKALGSAFQKVNFLRDLAEDRGELGRSYFPALSGGQLTDAHKDELVADIRADLTRAAIALPLLPRAPRAAVAAAAALFTELTNLIDATPATEVAARRVSVPSHRKLYITARAAARSVARKGPHHA